MYWNEILTEETKALDLETAIPLIKKECSEIVSMYLDINKFLYRGTKKYIDLIYMSDIRQNRNPRNTPSFLNKIFIDYIKSKGFIANRNNSIFTTPLYTTAKQYGHVFYIFPTNGFSYTYADNVYDLFSDIDDYIRTKYRKKHGQFVINLKYFYDNHPEEIREYITEFLNTIEFKNTDLEKFIIFNENEIMISGNKYYAITTQLSKEELLDMLK